MVKDNDIYVVKGPAPTYSVPNTTFGETLYNILLSAPAENVAMVDAFTGNTLSFFKLLEDSCNLALALRSHGYDKDCLIGLCSENSLHFLTIVLATLFNSTPLALFNPNSTEFELKYTLDIVKPKIVYSSSRAAEKLIRLKEQQAYLERIIVIDDVYVKETEALKDFIRKFDISISTINDFHVKHVDPKTNIAFILFSSGTTGLPKGVMLSHFNWNTLFVMFGDPTSTCKTDIGLMPFYHIFGLGELLYALKSYRRLIVFKNFDEDLFLKTVQDYKLDSLTLPPTLAIMLVKSRKVKNYDLSHVKRIACGSAPLKEETELKIKERFGNINTAQGYGMTELTSIGTVGENRPGSVGKLLPDVSCIVRDPITEKPLAPFQPGELCFKGPMVMLGYYNNEKATKDMFTNDGWLRSGDIGYYDDEEYFYIVDRMKELIKYKGHQVAPVELEAILLNHPDIKDAGVVGLPDELCGELPLAFVVKEKGSDITGVKIQEYIAERVSSVKRLRGGVIFVSEIPKTSVGKIQRKILKDKALTYYSSSKSKL